MEFKKTYLKSSELSKIFNVNPSTISLWVKQGKLRPLKTPGRNFRFHRSEVERLLGEDSQAKETVMQKRREPRFPVDYHVFVQIDEEIASHSYNAVVRDISNHGMGLVVYDNNDLFDKLSKGKVEDLTILNRTGGLFKDVVHGAIKHYRFLEKGILEMGVAVE